MDYGNDWQYAHDRLCKTIVRYNGECFLVDKVMPDFTLVGKFLHTTIYDDDVIYIKDVDLTPPLLGNMNYYDECVYLSRLPCRQWKQGVRVEQLTYKKNDLLYSKPFKDVLKNNYPSFDTCMDYLENDEVKSLGFCRNFSMKKNKSSITIWYKNFGSVGGMNKDKPTLSNKHMFLQESLEEAMAS